MCVSKDVRKNIYFSKQEPINYCRVILIDEIHFIGKQNEDVKKPVCLIANIFFTLVLFHNFFLVTLTVYVRD